MTVLTRLREARLAVLSPLFLVLGGGLWRC